MVARSVWCRGSAPRRPAASTPKLRSSRRASSAGVIAGTRAAANSIASAIPSRRRTTAATCAAFWAVTAKSGLTASARSANSRTASASVIAARSASAPGTPSVGTGTSRSPSMPRPSRLVAKITSRSHDRCSIPASAAAPSRRCSQLSNSNSSCLPRKNSTMTSRVVWPARVTRENTAATASSTPATSRTGARSHSHVPLPNRGDTCPAICNARRVFPTPPGPVKVTTRASPNAAAICSSSLALPMNEVTCNGKLPLRPASVRIGGKSARRSAWVS
jgi:hypothetical protein